MTAGVYNITIEQNATYTETITWRDSAGAPINLTGYTAKATVVNSGGTTIATLSSAGGVDGTITLGGATGTIIMSLPATFTATLTPQTASYDLILTNGSTKTRLIQGSATISRGYTT